jgi:hypothetical protein
MASFFKLSITLPEIDWLVAENLMKSRITTKADSLM